MAYVKIIYQDSPSTATPLNAQNLNHMDDGIFENDRRLNDLAVHNVKSFNGREGDIVSAYGDYDISQIAPTTGATVGQIPIVVNNGTEEEPELAFGMQDIPIPSAEDIDYDNTTSQLTADDVQEAIDEVKGIADGKVSKSGDTMTGVLNIKGNRHALNVNSEVGTTSSVGDSFIDIGNSTPEGTDKNSRGILRLYGKGAYYGQFLDDTRLTADRAYALPDKSGTIALTSDLTASNISYGNETVASALTRTVYSAGHCEVHELNGFIFIIFNDFRETDSCPFRVSRTTYGIGGIYDLSSSDNVHINLFTNGNIDVSNSANQTLTTYRLYGTVWMLGHIHEIS